MTWLNMAAIQPQADRLQQLENIEKDIVNAISSAGTIQNLFTVYSWMASPILLNQNIVIRKKSTEFKLKFDETFCSYPICFGT